MALSLVMTDPVTQQSGFDILDFNLASHKSILSEEDLHTISPSNLQLTRCIDIPSPRH